jgi:hypothetical protein
LTSPLGIDSQVTIENQNPEIIDEVIENATDKVPSPTSSQSECELHMISPNTEVDLPVPETRNLTPTSETICFGTASMVTSPSSVATESEVSARPRIELDDFGYESESGDDLPLPGIQSDEDDSADENEHHAPKRYCGGLVEGSVVHKYVVSIKENLLNKSSSVYKAVAKGNFWIHPPNPTIEVYFAKDVKPDAYYLPRIYAFIPQLALPSLDFNCPNKCLARDGRLMTVSTFFVL